MSTSKKSHGNEELIFLQPGTNIFTLRSIWSKQVPASAGSMCCNLFLLMIINHKASNEYQGADYLGNPRILLQTSNPGPDLPNQSQCTWIFSFKMLILQLYFEEMKNLLIHNCIGSHTNCFMSLLRQSSVLATHTCYVPSLGKYNSIYLLFIYNLQ